MDLLFVDVETGGLDPEMHSLLQVGLVAYKDGKILGTEKFYLSYPQYTVTPTAMNINKIDLSKAKLEGCDEKTAIHRINNFISKYFYEERVILVGHNVAFDKVFLKKLYKNNHKEFEDHVSHRMIDTMSLIWGLVDAGKLPSKAASSSGAFEHFNIKIDKLHDALDDALGTVELYKKLIELIK